MSRRLVAAAPLALLSVACPGAESPPADARAACAHLDGAACARARALVVAAATYEDEQHDFVLTGRTPGPGAIAPGVGLARAPAGWRPTRDACARVANDAQGSAPSAPAAVTYAFAGIAVDGTLVSADADLAPLLGASPNVHDVRLVAVALTGEPRSAPSEPAGAVVVRAADDACTCGDATHFAGAARLGATLSFDFRAPRDARHQRALDYVRRALGDRRVPVHESNSGLAIDGLLSLLDPDPRPLVFRVVSSAPVALPAEPLDDLCALPTPQVTPSSLDFGVAPYGVETVRTVRVVNRSALELRALVGAETIALPARGAVDVALRWAPEGDASRCETQTRDESILFVPARAPPPRDGGVGVERRARVFETVRTGRPRVAQAQRLEALVRRAGDYAAADREWTCPAGYARASCAVENRSPLTSASAESVGTDRCRFACRGPTPGKDPVACRFDAAMECALSCP